MLNICILHLYKISYSETFIRAHIEHLPANVEVLYGGSPPTYQLDNDRNIQSIWLRGMCFIIRRVFHRDDIASRFKRLALRRFLKRHEVDVVLAEYGPAGVSAMDVCVDLNLPFVVHFHGYDAYVKSILRKFGSAYKRMLVSAAAIIAVSRDMEQQLLSLGAPRERLFYNPYGVDTAFFSQADPASARPTFVAVGRFVDKKGPHLTLLAFNKVVKACSEARLIMIGDGILLESCKQLTRALGMTHAVEFLGAGSHAEVARAMRKARAFVQHSIKTSSGDSEGTPVAILEAQGTGLPVVSTYHAGIPDVVIHQNTGFLVDEGDVNSMAEYMIKLVEDEKLAATMGQCARGHVCSNFTMEKSIGHLWEIIENASHKNSFQTRQSKRI